MGKYAQAVWAIIRLAPVPEALDIRNDDAHAPLHLAVLTRQHEIVRILLLAGAKVSVCIDCGNFCFCFVQSIGHCLLLLSHSFRYVCT